MNELEKEIERLISEKIARKKSKITISKKLFISVEEMIALKEHSAKIARQKLQNLEKNKQLDLDKKINNSNLTIVNSEKPSNYIEKFDLIKQLRLAKVSHKSKWQLFRY